MNDNIKKVELVDELKNCPTCGYRDGFHSMFRRIEDEIRIFSICPSCHDVFDINLSVTAVEENGS